MPAALSGSPNPRKVRVLLLFLYLLDGAAGVTVLRPACQSLRRHAPSSGAEIKTDETLLCRKQAGLIGVVRVRFSHADGVNSEVPIPQDQELGMVWATLPWLVGYHG